MLMTPKLKPIGPYLIGMVVDYIGRPSTAQRRYVLSSRRWYVVHVHSQREGAVEEEIEDKQMAAYVPRAPRKMKTRPHVHRTVSRPIFTGYVFAGFDVGSDAWDEIRSIDGVIRLFTVHDQPIPISDMVMLRIRNKERELSDPNAECVPMTVKPGASVRIVDYGGFTGLFAMVTEVDVKTRHVCLEVEVMRRKVPLWLLEENVEVV